MIQRQNNQLVTYKEVRNRLASDVLSANLIVTAETKKMLLLVPNQTALPCPNVKGKCSDKRKFLRCPKLKYNWTENGRERDKGGYSVNRASG